MGRVVFIRVGVFYTVLIFQVTSQRP